jgi:cobalt/nickel transport protein
MTTQTEQPKRFNPWVIFVGIGLIILLIAIPLVMIQDSEFGGSDGAGSEVVAALAPDYDAEWITNWWAPPGGETESMLFALQATAGGILIGYCFGYLNGRKKGRKE